MQNFSKPLGEHLIVVTSPTGHIGSDVLANLLDARENVRVVVRDPTRLPPASKGRVEIVQGSHGDRDVVERAFAGADSVFWLVPVDSSAATVDKAYLDFSRPACEAFKSQGVKRVVGISALGRGVDLPAGHVTATLKLDDLIAGTGVHYRALLNPSFMENFLRQVESIEAQGMFFSPEPGDLKVPSCSTRDIAAVATKWLIDSTWTGVGGIPVLGPEDLSHNEMAKIMSDVIGKQVTYQQIPAESMRPRLLSNGFSEAMAQAMIEMLDAKSKGLDNAEPRTVEGTTPTSFRQWCELVLKPALSDRVSLKR